MAFPGVEHHRILQVVGRIETQVIEWVAMVFQGGGLQAIWIIGILAKIMHIKITRGLQTVQSDQGPTDKSENGQRLASLNIVIYSLVGKR